MTKNITQVSLVCLLSRLAHELNNLHVPSSSPSIFSAPATDPMRVCSVDRYRSINIVMFFLHFSSKFCVITFLATAFSSCSTRGKSSTGARSIRFFKLSSFAKNLCNTNAVLWRFFLCRSANFHMRNSSRTLLMHVFSDLTLSCRWG
jgi:hypothetical protein